MMKKLVLKLKTILANKHFLFLAGILFLLTVLSFFNMGSIFGENIPYEKSNEEEHAVPKIEPLDTALYDLKLEKLANNPISLVVEPKFDATTGQPIPAPKPTLWPV